MPRVVPGRAPSPEPTRCLVAVQHEIDTEGVLFAVVPAHRVGADAGVQFGAGPQDGFGAGRRVVEFGDVVGAVGVRQEDLILGNWPVAIYAPTASPEKVNRRMCGERSSTVSTVKSNAMIW